jgi:hypothetical protein
MFWFLSLHSNCDAAVGIIFPEKLREIFPPRAGSKFSVDFFSTHELMANFRDTPGDKSHKAFDFLLRRMSWEGAPNLESLKDTRTSEIRRLADILEQAFLRYSADSLGSNASLAEPS